MLMTTNGVSMFDVAKSFSIATLFLCAAIYVYLCRKKLILLGLKLKELEASLASSASKCASERQGRVRAQAELRNSLARHDSAGKNLYPMYPIGIVHSCFSTRNGTPRQPLIVPLAKACVTLDTSRVPPSSLEGLAEYSHCWIIYVFHLNTDLEKLWRDPSRSRIKAKVRVPRLKGERIGLFATRSPHRPCPIGLTVAKVDEVRERESLVFLSGVDLVDGTPVLDLKPYLPYCDSIESAKVPEWVKSEDALAVASVSFSERFESAMAGCWRERKNSLYSSAEEFRDLVKQVLSWDIRSVSQRSQRGGDDSPVIYHLALFGYDISYRMNEAGQVFVLEIVISDAPAG